jgi:hypothetical protein
MSDPKAQVSERLMDTNREGESTKPEPELMMYWHTDYWDMPLSGVAMYKGQPAYFQHVEEADDDVDEENQDDPEHVRPYVEPTYTLHALTEAQYRELEAQHDEFGRLVGRHTDYRPGVYAPYQDNGTKHLWYDNAAARRLSFNPTQDCPIVATVPSSAFRRPT